MKANLSKMLMFLLCLIFAYFPVLSQAPLLQVVIQTVSNPQHFGAVIGCSFLS